MDKELEQYIVNARSSGMQDEDIRAELERTGWPQQEIKCAFVAMEKGSNRTTWVTVVVVVVLAVVYAVTASQIGLWPFVAENEHVVTEQEISLMHPNGGEVLSLDQPVDIRYQISSDFKEQLTTDVLMELYLVRPDGILEGYIGRITDYSETSFVWDPQELKHWAGLDMISRPPPAGQYRVLFLARRKASPTHGGDRPVDILVDGQDRFDGEQVLVMREGSIVAEHDLIAADISDSTFRFIEPDPTANWQTYRNEEFGFEVKHPDDWNQTILTRLNHAEFGVGVDPSLTQEPVDFDRPFAFSVRVYADLESLEDGWQDKARANSLENFLYKEPKVLGAGPRFVDIEEKVVGGRLGWKADAGPNVFGGGTYYFVETGGFIYQVWLFGSHPERRTELDQILSTFEFIKES